MDLKKVLMVLGNRLVTEAGCAPANISSIPPQWSGTTAPLTILTLFLNQSERARSFLAEMGVDWSMVGEKIRTPEQDFSSFVSACEHMKGKWQMMAFAFFVGRGIPVDQAKQLSYKLFPEPPSAE